VPDARLEVVLSSLNGSMMERPRAASATGAGRWAPATPEPAAPPRGGGGGASLPLPVLSERARGSASGGAASGPLLSVSAASGAAASSAVSLSLLATLSGASSSAAAASPREGAVTMAQEQMEGMRRLRCLKSRLQVSTEGGSLSAAVYPQSLTKAMSVGSDAAAATAAAAAPAAPRR
jgi:hypothetical protein